jgi:hypothetical protein
MASPNPWSTVTSTLSLAAGAYQIRLAETDNQGFFNMGVDNVSISTGAVPEPSTWALLTLGFAGIGFASLRRRGAAASVVSRLAVQSLKAPAGGFFCRWSRNWSGCARREAALRPSRRGS